MGKNTKNTEIALKILLYVFAAYHVLIGLAGIFLTDMAKDLAKSIFNFHLTMDAQTLWMVKPLAAYMLVFGILMFFVVKDFEKYKIVIYSAVGFIAIRVIQRILFLVQGQEFMANANPTTSILGIIFLAIYGGAIFLLTKKV